MANPSSPNGEHTGTAETARRDMESVKEAAREDFDEIKHRAKEDFDAARREAGSYAESQKNYAADQIAGIASAFERVGDELGSGEQPWAGRYAHDAAHRLEDMANRARSSNLNEMVGDVERFGRERPGAFLATAALMGFAASRFLMASSHRRSRPGPANYSDPAYAGDPYYASRDDGARSSGYGGGGFDGPKSGEQS